MVNKLPELHYRLYSSDKADCLCVTESWLHDGLPNGLLDPQAMYDIFRCDRSNGRCGGVCVLIQRKMVALQIMVTDMPAGIELVCFELTHYIIPVRIFVVYRPPNIGCNVGLTAVDMMSQLTHCLEMNLNNRGPSIILGISG